MTTLESEILGPTQRDVPWRGIGTDVRELKTAEECIKAAGLDWEVAKLPAGFQGSDGWVPDEGSFKIVRTDTMEPLGNVADIYEPLQNREAFEFSDSLVDSGDAKYDTAGALRGGRVIFLAMKFPEGVTIAGEDPIDLYGVLWNSHDGTKAITEMATPIRPVCMNTLQLGLKRARTTWSIKHTGSLEGKLEVARRSLELSFRYAEVWADEMDRLAQRSFSDSEFEQLVQRLTGPGTRLGERWADGLLGSWEGGPERGTHSRSNRYDAYNAITEYGDWLRAPRTPESQVESTMFGAASRLRKQAFTLLSGAEFEPEQALA